MANLKPQAVNRLLMISLHIVGWVTFISLPFIFMDPRRIEGRPGNPANYRPPPGDIDIELMRTQSFFFSLLLIIFFYVNMYVLIPKVLTKKSWTYYMASVILSFGLILLASEAINILLSDTFSRAGRPLYFVFFNFVLVFGLSTALRLTSDRVQFDRERKERENENLKSELQLLRSQVSPHFMFNVLNNLASLARKKSDELESVIIQLSHLMRYMLYDTGEKKVSINNEIEYLQSYIELQRLRFGNDISINFETDVANGELPIEPMLLIPFVENAFKHGMGIIADPSIMISLKIVDHELMFSVRNKFNKTQRETKDSSSGIGIQNVRRRLDLLYKDLHELKIYDADPWFVVELKLILR